MSVIFKKRFNANARNTDKFRKREDVEQPKVDKEKKMHNDSSDDASCSSSDDETTVVTTVHKRKRKNPMIQSSGVGSSKRKADMVASSSSDSEEESPTTKPSSISLEYKSSGAMPVTGPQDMGATSTMETETEFDKDSQAQFEKGQEYKQESWSKEDDKKYRGMKSYQTFREVKDTVIGKASKGFNTKGPIRAPTNLRQTVRWDYQPHVCKDYKETGFCTFGDSCIFMHDRSDYKQGWELDREWDSGRYGKSDRDYKINSSDDEDFPFACFICREAFKDPVVSKCNHYFCEKCALDGFKRSMRCFVCGKESSGIFTPAKALIAYIKKKQEKADKSDHSSDDEFNPNPKKEKEIPVKEIEQLPTGSDDIE